MNNKSMHGTQKDLWPVRQFESAHESSLSDRRRADMLLTPLMIIGIGGALLFILFSFMDFMDKPKITFPPNMYDQLSPAQIELLSKSSYEEAQDALKSLGLADSPGSKYLLGQMALREGVKLSPDVWQAAIDDMPEDIVLFEKMGAINQNFYYRAEKAAYGAAQSNIALQQAQRWETNKINRIKFLSFYYIIPVLLLFVIRALLKRASHLEAQAAKKLFDDAAPDDFERMQDILEIQILQDQRIRREFWLMFMFSRPTDAVFHSTRKTVVNGGA